MTVCKKGLGQILGGVEVVMQESPPYDHRANGAAEVVVRDINWQTRAVIFDAERLRLSNSILRGVDQPLQGGRS